MLTEPEKVEHEQLRIEMRRLEDAVNKSNDDGLRARWESGRCLMKLRRGKPQLPQGVAGELMKDLGVSRSELTARMKFAETCETDDDFANIATKFKNWFAIKQKALTDKPHRRNEKAVNNHSTRLQHILTFVVETLDGKPLSEGDLELLAQIEACIQRLKKDAKTLKREAA